VVLNRSHTAPAVVMSLVLLGFSAAQAMPVHGAGATITLGEDFYIPIRPETSGTYGELAAFGPHGHIVGMDRDQVVLNAANNSSAGEVMLLLTFDISDELTEEFPVIDPDAEMPLTLSFSDLDFLPVTQGPLEFREWLELTLVDEAGVALAGSVPIVLDETTYLTYRQDVDGSNQQVVATDGLKATYELSLLDLLSPGVRDDFIEQLSSDKKFHLLMKFGARLDYSGYGSAARRNTVENMSDSFLFFSLEAPEPGAASLLVLGAVAVVMRRRGRKSRPG